MLWLLAACHGSALTGDTGSDSGCAAAPEPLIVGVGAICSGDRATLAAELLGIARAGEVLVVDPATPAWTELHDLATTDYDRCGATSTAGVEIGTEAPFERDVASPLTCADFAGSALTWAFAVYEPLDPGDPGHPVVADCVASGADPRGLVRGTYDASFVSSPSFDVRACRVR